MRLLHVESLKFAQFHNDNTPRYVIASHRWCSEGEATFKDIHKDRNPDSIGYHKVQAFANYIKNYVPSVEWLWIDTCCINKQDAAELSEAINSMFE